MLDSVLSPRSPIGDPVLADRFRGLLNHAENESVADRLRGGRLTFTPVNKETGKRIASDLHARGLHLPWALKPMNFDFGARIAASQREHPLPFAVFYSEAVSFDAAQGTVEPGRLFSMPIFGNARGTWAEPIVGELLDEDVGILIEADSVLP
jgi:hypothetical protein